jgi:hypothetical protein
MELAASNSLLLLEPEGRPRPTGADAAPLTCIGPSLPAKRNPQSDTTARAGKPAYTASKHDPHLLKW